MPPPPPHTHRALATTWIQIRLAVSETNESISVKRNICILNVKIFNYPVGGLHPLTIEGVVQCTYYRLCNVRITMSLTEKQ